MAVAAVAPLSPTAPYDTLLSDLQRLKITRLLVDGYPPLALLDAASELGLPVLPLNPLGMASAAGEPFPLPAATDLALLLQTSGTTSQPKVVPLSHANLLASARSVADVLALGPDDRSLAAMPLFHIHGIVASLLAPLLAGGSVICCRSNAPDALLHLLASLQPTWLSAVPTLLQGLLAELDRNGAAPPPHQLRLLRSSSSPLPPAVLERLEAVFQVPVLEAYGMTEAAHQICSNRLPGSGPGSGRRPGSVGMPAGPDVVVLGTARQPLPAGESGEIAIRGPGVSAGYEGAGESGWVVDAAGERWFLTGDEGCFDAQGRLALTGRLKEMINRGGAKVIPRRVDEALLQHPAVEQALAFALPHPTLGEDLAAAVVLRAGALADEQELRRHTLAVLAPHEVPSLIVLLPELPRGATGKLQRIGLADKLGELLLPSEEPANGDLEELVAQTFAAVLRQAPPGRNANFFLLGGDSLSGQRVVYALEQQLALDLSPTLLFAYPTTQSLAEQLDQLLDRALAQAEADIR
jgi:acyl-CoA synthetase (AMP-forming)/AMP-acid ligase II/acyl carrier protein